MREKFVIKGGKKLSGSIPVMGAKNSATSILAATLLTEKNCYLDNLPKIKDVLVMIDILKSLGSQIEWQSEKMVKINNQNVSWQKIDFSLINKLRSSILFLGPLLAKFGKLKISQPGGCLIGARPLDTHLDVFETFGFEIKRKDNFLFFEKKKNWEGGEVVLKEFSVTATENAMIFASFFEKKTIIKTAALEPYIQDLAKFLRKLGVKIKFLFDHQIEIFGKKNLAGAKHFLIFDPIEAGTFIALSLASKSSLVIENVQPEFLTSVFKKVKEIGAELELKERREGIFNLKVIPTRKLNSFKLQTLPYPGFPTDLQASFGVVATQAEGVSFISDSLYEGRLKYLEELIRMGAKAVICNPHQALIVGPASLYGQKIVGYDLRAGASLVLAGLIASGKTEIFQVEQVDRGYQEIEKRLQTVGADIKRVKD